jgi:hypothetical protein
VVTLALAGVAVPAFAGAVSVSTSTLAGTGLSSPGMDHHAAYTWTINGVNIGGSGFEAKTASLTFFNFKNWSDADPNNIIFMNLLDGTIGTQTATTCGGSGFTTCTSAAMMDSTASGTMGLHDVSNAFQVAQDPLGVGNSTAIGVLVGASTPNTYLGSSRNTADATQTAYGYNPALVGDNPGLTGAFGTTPVPQWKYTFNSAQLAALTAYINDGSPIAFGLDPDCHFMMSSIQFDMSYGAVPGAAVPEPGTLMLLGSGVAYLIRRRTQARSA